MIVKIDEWIFDVDMTATMEYSAKEAANILAEKTGAEVIQVIGYRFVLYRFNPEKHK